MEGLVLLCEFVNKKKVCSYTYIACLIEYCVSISNCSPLDMLGIPQHRLVYASIFGLMTDTFLSLIIDDSATSLCSDGGFTMGNILCKTG